MEIIVKLLPERANCPAGSTTVNFCLFFLQKRLQPLLFGTTSFAALRFLFCHTYRLSAAET